MGESTAELRARLMSTPMPEPVYSQVGSGDGRTAAQLRADLAQDSDAWAVEALGIGTRGATGQTEASVPVGSPPAR